MGKHHEMAFTQFLALRHKNFQRIACKTGGEYTTDDIKGEAWIMAHHIQDTKGISIDFSDKQFQELLLSFLYQHFVRYTERHVRFSQRLDDNDEFASNPEALINDISKRQSNDPLTQLERQEFETLKITRARGYSQAMAYLYLLRKFNSDISALARYLTIPNSQCLKRIDQAASIAEVQHSILINPIYKFISNPWGIHARLPIQFFFTFEVQLDFNLTVIM